MARIQRLFSSSTGSASSTADGTSRAVRRFATLELIMSAERNPQDYMPFVTAFPQRELRLPRMDKRTGENKG